MSSPDLQADVAPLSIDSTHPRVQASVKNAVSSVLTCISAEFPILDWSSGSEAQYQSWVCEQALALLTADCQQRRAEAQARHNSMAPLHQLPLEIFTDILLASMEKGYHRLRDIKCLRKVSRYWKEVIDSSPQCWASIHHSHDPPAFASAFLRKSKLSPLDICCDIGPSAHETWRKEPALNQFLELVRPHSDRIRSITIKHWFTTEVGTQLIPTFLPILQELTMHCNGSALPGPPFTVPNTPALTTLSLSYVTIKWTPLSTSKLVYLKLSHIRNPPSVRELLDALATSPLLQSIWIWTWTGDDGSEVVGPWQHGITLRHLTDLVLSKVPRALTRAILHGAEGCMFKACAVDDVLPDMLRPCAASFRAIWEELGLAVVRAPYNNSSVISVEASRHLDHGPSDRSLRIKIKADSSQLRDRLEETLEWLSSSDSSPAVRLEVGYFCSVPGHATESLKLSVQACPRLTHLKVGRMVKLDDVFDYLATPHQEEDGTWVWPCPNLEHLDLSEWKGSAKKLVRLAKSRWEVPGSLKAGPVPRKKLQSFGRPQGQGLDQAVPKNCASDERA